MQQRATDILTRLTDVFSPEIIQAIALVCAIAFSVKALLAIRPKKILVASAVLSAVFAFILFTGKPTAYPFSAEYLYSAGNGYTTISLSNLYAGEDGMFSVKQVLLAVFSLSATFLILFPIISGSLYVAYDNFENKLNSRLLKHHSLLTALSNFASKHACFFLAWGIIFVCWIPYFLILYPGLVTYDPQWEIHMILGSSPYSAHHSIIHTLMLFPFIKLGQAVGSLNAGIACFSIFQMLYMSAAFAFAVYYLCRRGVHPFFAFAALVYFAVFPINSYYSVTAWKDIPFAAALLIFTLAVIEIIRTRKEFFSAKSHWVWLILSAIGLSTLRDNGLYIVILMFSISLFFTRGFRKNIIIAFGCCAAFYALYIGVLYPALDVQKKNITEALSIPAQQLAYVAHEHWDEFSVEDKEVLQLLFSKKIEEGAAGGYEEHIGKYYSPFISDPVKFRLDLSSAENRKLFFSIWFDMLKRYPREYIKAFIDVGIGYWNPYVIYWTVSNGTVATEIYEFDMVIPPLDIYSDSVFPKIFNIFLSYNPGNMRVVPIIGLFYNIGFNFWVFIVCAVLTILKRQARYLLSFLPVFLLWLTCLASPVYAEFRYIYGLFVCLPVLLPTALSLRLKTA